MQHVKVSQDRIGVLIGKGGSTFREIENRAEARFDVDPENGSVAIDSVDDFALDMVAPDVVRAVGRGSAPEDAMVFLDDDMMMFELIDIDRHTRNKNDMRRQRGCLIGENGRIHELMEELMGADAVIYGTTLGIIDQLEEVEVVRQAVEMTLDGAPYNAVYSFLKWKHNELTQGFNARQNN